MKRFALIIMLMLGAAAAASAGGPVDGHPSSLPRVKSTTTFPLFRSAELARHGYPDHQHEFFWPGWTPPMTAEGEPYGFGTFCSGLHAKDRAGFVIEPGKVSFGPFVLTFNPEAEACLVAPFLGFCEMALIDASDLLGLEPSGELHIINPDDTATYTARTGYGTWRMFRYRDGAAIVQPVGILARRTLISHAARDLVARWLLDVNDIDDAPAWLRDGLSTWFAEMGVHLCNYMAAYRLEESVLMTPDAIEAVLSSRAVQDAETDRSQYRMARYGAFLMVWHLVEDHGGLDPLRAALKAMSDGVDPESAFEAAYGKSLSDLASLVDPNVAGEPVGEEVQPRNPSRPPVTGG